MTTTPVPLTGKLVRLTAMNLEADPEVMAHWARDNEYQRLYGAEPAGLWSAKECREHLENDTADFIVFAIHTLEDDRLIGTIDLGGFDWTAQVAWVGIGIGEREYWGKGYGSDAMRVMLRYAFEELNLQRVSLDVFEYNERGISCYQKCGFKEEGRLRQVLYRYDKRWDMILMGILRSEWQPAQG